ncbi:unnamed protein product [Cylicocyclus nassatus]|uniref:G-protein coupled receptors family 1 profile domain-containing protein n=1 Tax=Cylicocyclus nassatus TaxID=53992 RepID=A0AA36HF64_CYLNA|nr:unnamed protein product [Cylicocyclus nassatus]
MANNSLPEFPMIDWCFDIEMYYASSEQNIAAQMRNTFQEYKQFSFRYNGVLTSILVALGLAGSLLLLKQIYSSHVFSKRLAIHLGMICIWDSLYLVACLATYGVPSLLYGMIPVYGVMAYILFLLQPFASFCVSCTIWQVFAITLERYLAVSKPLEQRARTARFAAGWLCAAIAAGAFVLNLLPVPFERQLVPCFEIVGSRLRNHTLLKPYDDGNSRLYRFVVHFFPDLIFRAPLPIIFIGTLTVKTIHACNQRSVGNVQLTSQINRNIPLRLYLLNFKFILCNTLYMFNTILLELLGYGESVESNEEGLIDRYMNSFYLTDASNMLLNSRRLAGMTLTSSYRVVPVKPRVAEFVLRRIVPVKRSIGIEILTKICSSNPEMVPAIVGTQKSLPDGELYSCIPSFQNKGEQIGQFVEQVLKWFCDRGRDEGIRQLGRRLGHAYYHSNIQFSAEQWKIIRAQVVAIIIRHTLKEPFPKEGCCSVEELQETLTRVFNFVLCEMRSGVLCAAVEAKKRVKLFALQSPGQIWNNRASVSGVWAVPQDPTKRPRSQNGRRRCSLQNNGLLPLLITEASSK